MFGGGISNVAECSPEVTHCTFYGNYAPYGDVMYNDQYSFPVMRNCIFWEIAGEGFFSIGHSFAIIQYSDVQGGYVGIGNMQYNPKFVDPDHGDFHLLYSSHCRDAGDNSAASEPTDFEGDPRNVNGIVDMGADEFSPHLYCTGDFTPSGSIEGKLVGQPDAWPVGLFIGSGIKETPLQHQWGAFYMEDPWLLIPLAPIPTDGILVIPTEIPATPAAPYDIFMQALINDSFTNPFVLEVR